MNTEIESELIKFTNTKTFGGFGIDKSISLAYNIKK